VFERVLNGRQMSDAARFPDTLDVRVARFER
jgi:hypothetical protein